MSGTFEWAARGALAAAALAGLATAAFAQDKPADDVYYFALFVAANIFRDFCGNGCVAGISTLGGDGEFGQASERYGTGI
ncbi:MAG: hypothetical protein INR63_30230, partial [Actinomycetospora chiangmaiensis]|nr:hypothetical protein [Actinomycetospora chiangmaiensis]